MKVKVQEKLSEGAPVRADQDFTGVARSVECFNNQGFSNFRIITLHIKNGKVERKEFSDPYASFEAISRLELVNELAMLNLNNNWASGKTLSK
jgi:F420-dependent methylenetetrahydromethanopterin dehydrogenase